MRPRTLGKIIFFATLVGRAQLRREASPEMVGFFFFKNHQKEHLFKGLFFMLKK